MFVSLVYAKAWTTSTNACDAPLNDLELFKACHKYSSTSVIISKAATSTLGRHLWYLGEELVTLSLFSDKVPKETKQAMVCRLRDFNKQSSQLNSTRSRRSCDVDIIEKSLESFVGARTVSFFSILQLDSSFLSEEISKCSQLESYQKSLETVQALKVVNDSAERAIALATDFNTSATKQEEQKQFLFQTVESHRKQFPNCAKSTLLGKTEQVMMN